MDQSYPGGVSHFVSYDNSAGDDDRNDDDFDNLQGVHFRR